MRQILTPLAAALALLAPVVAHAAPTPVSSLAPRGAPAGSDTLPDLPNGAPRLQGLLLSQLETWLAGQMGGGAGSLISVTCGAGLSGGAITTTGTCALIPQACAWLTDAAPSCATDATNAANIVSGTLPAARLPATTVTPGAYANANITVGADGRLTAAASGGGGTPGGASGQVQYDNAGAFGGIANGAAGQVLTANASGPPSFQAAVGGAMVLLASVTTSGNQATVMFSSSVIPTAGYTDLILVVRGRLSGTSGSTDYLGMILNGDSASGHYATGSMETSNGGALTVSSGMAAFGFIGNLTNANEATAAKSGQSETTIANFLSTTFYPTWSSESVNANSASSNSVDVVFVGGAWTPTTPAAITSVELEAGGGADHFIDGAVVSLYARQ